MESQSIICGKLPHCLFSRQNLRLRPLRSQKQILNDKRDCAISPKSGGGVERSVYCERTEVAAMEVSQNLELLKIVERLKLEFEPTRIILFGSRALANARSDSDFDLVVVVRSTSLSRIERMEKARKAIRDLHVSADVFVFTTTEFDLLKHSFSSIPETAESLGIELKVS